MAYRYRYCRNPKCREGIGDIPRLFCPSCRYMGGRAFALGSFVAGLIAWCIR